jgi:GntR family transcriptional regulator
MERNGIDHFRVARYSRRTVATAGPQRVTKQSATRQQVLDLIERLGVGNAIPSERQLSADLGVSRLTVRAALDDLAREGYVVRRRGSGTYVQQPKIAQELTMTSFSEDMRRRGMTPGSRTLSLERELAGARLGRLLHVSPSEEILVIKRLRLADGETMAIETLHLPSSLVPGLEPGDLAGSFYDLVRDRYGLVIVSGTQAIEPTVTDEEESKALGVPLHSPAFLFERTSRDEAGRTLEYVQSVYRGDRYRIVTELSRPAL